jgi:hypothetical protein
MKNKCVLKTDLFLMLKQVFYKLKFNFSINFELNYNNILHDKLIV